MLGKNKKKSNQKETEYDNTNSGALFENNRKNSDKHPDLTGSLNVGGKEYWVSAWENESKSGDAYYKLSVKLKEDTSEEEEEEEDEPVKKSTKKGNGKSRR